MNLTPQQADAIDWVIRGHGSAIMEAVAGSGKTTTLVEICKQSNGKVAAAMFNKKNAVDFNEKLRKAGCGSNVKAGTFHSYGNRVWSGYAPLADMVADKTRFLCDELGVRFELRSFVQALVSIAKQHVLGPKNDAAWHALAEHHDLEERLSAENGDLDEQVDEGISSAVGVYEASIRDCTKRIDFDDMIFAPLWHGLSFPQHDWVQIDEAQDTNPARRLMAARMLSDRGRLLAVGDRHQAIYGFTGADADAMDLISSRFDCCSLPLTVSFRCARSIIELAQTWVPHIEARDDAPDGSVSRISIEEFNKNYPQPGDAVLCRNTKPLIELALFYLRQHIPAHVEGRDIGQQLIALATKWKRVRHVGTLRLALEKYFEAERERLIKREQYSKVGQLEDRVQSLLAIISTLHDDDPIAKVESTISNIFKDTEGTKVPTILLSTIHKAKGREWPKVYLYGRNKYMPSFYAKAEWQLGQEKNLAYVAVTRAMNDLIEVEVP